MKKDLILKVSIWIIVLANFFIMFTEPNEAASYIPILLPALYVLAYAYGYVKSQVVVVIASLVFTVVYLFYSISILDAILWAVVLATQFDYKKTK